jgi:hypothetical protein
MPRDRASGAPTGRSDGAPTGRQPTRPVEPPAAPTEAVRVPELVGAADMQSVPARRVAARTAEVHMGQPAAALHTPLAASCTRAEGHKRPMERRVAARHSPEGRLPLAKPWHQTDSSPLGNRSARDRPRARPQTRSHQREGDRCSTPVPEVEPERKAPDLVAAKRAARAAALHKAVEQPPAARPRRKRVGAVALAVREGRHELAEAQLLRPMDCRKTGKTCWWAGSRRRTACTRSCEKLPSSSYGALTCASLAPGSIPVLPRHYAAKGGGMCSETIRAEALSLI